MSESFVLYVEGITCGVCSGSIEKAIKNEFESNVESVIVDITSKDPKKLAVSLKSLQNQNHQKVWEKLKKSIEAIGFDCKSYDYLPPEEMQFAVPSPVSIKKRTGVWKKFQALISSHWFQGTSGTLIGLGILILNLAFAPLSLASLIAIGVVSLLLTTALGARSYYDAWKKLVKSKTLTMDALFAISSISVILVSFASFWVPWLPMMFETSILIYGFRHIGIAIEETIKEKINTSKFQDRAPKTVKLWSHKGITPTHLSQVESQDILIVNPGEIIPVDAISLSEGLIHNTIITGGTLPVPIQTGHMLQAGMSLAKNGEALKIQALRAAKDSYLAKLDKNISDSMLQKMPLEIKAQQILNYFIPSVILLALFSGTIISLFFPPAAAIQCAVSVLVSACPCTLALIIPLAVKTGIHKATEQGIQFKKAQIQQLEQIDTVIFDLHGTLTTGMPKIECISPIETREITEQQLLNVCHSLEKKSTHIIGRSIYDYTQEKNGQGLELTEVDNSHHSGISGKVDGVLYTIGSKTLMEAKSISTAILDGLNLKIGDHLVYIARENTLVGYTIIRDPLRPFAQQTINALKNKGIRVIVCTGADEKTAASYAKALNITEIQANTVGITVNAGDRSKPDFIKSLQDQGHKVAMVGDASNDAAAVKQSDFGFSFRHGDELTQEYAGAIVDNLALIVSAFTLSKQTVQNIKQNLIFSFAYNFVSILLAGGVLLALGINLPPALGVIFMAVQAWCIFYNVYLFKKQPVELLQEKNQDGKEQLGIKASLNLEPQNKKSLGAKVEPQFHLNSESPTPFKPSFFNSLPSQKKIVKDIKVGWVKTQQENEATSLRV